MNRGDVANVFAAEGPLGGAIAGYRPRPEQVAMAVRVDEALERRERLLVEAGTGVGKTFAYLVPTLMAGRKAIVSTATKSLQDQLYRRDLPAVSEAIGRPVTVAMLKGRGNYLCLHRLRLALDDAGPAVGRALATIAAWAQTTESGDVAEVPGVGDDSPTWPRVTSTADNCLGQSCPDYDDCHLVAARREAMRADVVIVNHHLLLADMVLKEEGFGELLPGADAVIVDEAHQLMETAGQFFGTDVSSRQLDELRTDLVAEALEAGVFEAALEAHLDALSRSVREARLALGQVGRHPWSVVAGSTAEALAQMGACLGRLVADLAGVEGHSPGLDHVLRRARAMDAALTVLLDDELTDKVRWLEVHRRGFVLHATPLDVGEDLGPRIRDQAGAWIFTSATLAVGEDFSHVASGLGLEDPATLRLDSPFDFPGQSRLYLPDGLPAPGAPDYTRAVLRTALPLIEAAGGRTFLLFTSHRAVREAADILRSRNGPLANLPVLVQGDAPRSSLLDRFRELGNAVLLGTSSFWEGVDVRGDALGLVVIDRLPFASPGDPVLAARLEAIEQEGGSGFRSLQLPRAVIALKQGVGRLIRDYTDSGVAVICDPRIRNRSYGRTFLASLPPMTRTSEEAEAVAFLRDDAADRVRSA